MHNCHAVWSKSILCIVNTCILAVAKLHPFRLFWLILTHQGRFAPSCIAQLLFKVKSIVLHLVKVPNKEHRLLSLKIHNVEFKDYSFARYYKASF